MYHNYFFLKRLANDLNHKLRGMELRACFTQNRDELIISFSDRDRSVFIRANLEPQISLLYIIEDFRRAKKNSVDIFEDLHGKKVIKVSSFRYDRSFAIWFEDNSLLIFKIHGSRSNIAFINSQEEILLFRNVLANDITLERNSLNQTFEVNEERFRACSGNPKQFLPALGKEVHSYLKDENFDKKNDTEKWQSLTTLLDQLERAEITITKREDSPPHLSLIKTTEKPIYETHSALEANNKYYELFTRDYYLNHSRRVAEKPLTAEIKKTENYLKKSKTKLEEIKNRRGYDEVANILMANLHQINRGEKKVELDDFYSGGKIEIKLNPVLTPQKNAENLYRKSKNQRLETDKLEENLKARFEKLKVLKAQLEEIRSAEDIREIRKLEPKERKSNTPVNWPYHQYTIHGYQIMVGKNAKHNDELTLKVANKNDLWLHAKDVTGSHVIIKHQAGKSLPKEVLEKAAQLASWFSKRKTDSLCPVIYTPKKYVRKRKGDPAGAVVVEREEVIMVVPKNFQDI